MINVLFVCLGNICRSPMAEALFREKVKEAGLADRIRIDSAGTSDANRGKPPHEGTRKLLERYQIDCSDIRSRQITQDDLLHHQYVIAMDSSNMSVLQSIDAPGAQAKLIRLLDLNPEYDIKDVPDPYYTGNFEEVYEMLDRGCDLLLEYIRENESM